MTKVQVLDSNPTEVNGQGFLSSLPNPYECLVYVLMGDPHRMLYPSSLVWNFMGNPMQKEIKKKVFRVSHISTPDL